MLDRDIDYSADLQPIVDDFTRLYAVTDEKYDEASCPVAKDDLLVTRGIEVGHIFYFGTKYSEPFGAKLTAADGSEEPVHMGSLRYRRIGGWSAVLSRRATMMTASSGPRRLRLSRLGLLT